MLGQQVMKHLRVLPRNGRTQYCEHARGETKINGQAVDVACPRARPCSQDHLVPVQVGNNFFNQRIHSAAPAVHNALAADLNHVDPGQDGKV